MNKQIPAPDNGLTPLATRLVAEMTAVGWEVSYRADSGGGRWEFAKIIGTGLSEIARRGSSTDIFVAAERAIKGAD